MLIFYMHFMLKILMLVKVINLFYIMLYLQDYQIFHYYFNLNVKFFSILLIFSTVMPIFYEIILLFI